jgi:hypothetical protein
VRTIFATTFAIAAVVLTAAPDLAEAQPEPIPEQLELARQAYANGAEAFAARDFKTAVDNFKESYRLSRNPLLLYNIGVTLEELGDKKLALFYYRKFLTDSPRDVKNRAEAAQAAAALVAELEGKRPPNGGDTGGDSGDTANTGDKSAAPTEFQHTAVGEAPPGKPLDITAFAPQNVGWKVYLYYRTKDEPDFTKVEMKQRYQEMVARIPAAKVNGSSIQYYVEARDLGDEITARSGKATSPHIVMIDAEAKARYYPDLEDERPWDPGSGADTPGRDTGKTDSMTYARWATTGGAVGFAALSVTFLIIASDAASAIEGEAFESTMQDSCPPEGRPCRVFDEGRRDLENRGKRFDLLGKVTLGLAVGSAAAAGVLWYLHSKEPAKNKAGSVSAAPAIGPDFVGGAARVTF